MQSIGKAMIKIFIKLKAWEYKCFVLDTAKIEQAYGGSVCFNRDTHCLSSLSISTLCLEAPFPPGDKHIPLTQHNITNVDSNNIYTNGIPENQ